MWHHYRHMPTWIMRPYQTFMRDTSNTASKFWRSHATNLGSRSHRLITKSKTTFKIDGVSNFLSSIRLRSMDGSPTRCLNFWGVRRPNSWTSTRAPTYTEVPIWAWRSKTFQGTSASSCLTTRAMLSTACQARVTTQESLKNAWESSSAYQLRNEDSLFVRLVESVFLF